MHQEVDGAVSMHDLVQCLTSDPYNVHDIVPLQMMSKMGGLGGMDNPMGVSVNPNSLSSNIVVPIHCFPCIFVWTRFIVLKQVHRFLKILFFLLKFSFK